MCQFCIQHGDGKRWYANAANYAQDLQSDLRRRGYMVGFVRDFERTRRTVLAGLSALRYVPRPLREPIAERVSRSQREQHFGQPVPLEQCDRILRLATHITRLPCVCRGAMRPGSDAESCCIVATVHPHDGVLAECFSGYRGGPAAEGFQKLTHPEAMAYLRLAEERGLAHTAWTFGTPFIAAIRNCDLPSGCLAMKTQLEGGIPRHVARRGRGEAGPRPLHGLRAVPAALPVRRAPPRCEGRGAARSPGVLGVRHLPRGLPPAGAHARVALRHGRRRDALVTTRRRGQSAARPWHS